MAEGGGNPEVPIARPPWKIGLDQCRVDICNDLQPLEVLPNLQARGVISQPMIDTIKGYPIRYNQNYALVTWLQTGPEETFEVFCEILRRTTQSHIEAIIRSKISDIKARQSIGENVEQINGSIDLPLSADDLKFIKSQIVSDDQRDINAGSEGYIIVAGGWNASGYVASSYAYDINLKTWSALPSLPSTRCGGGLVAQQDNAYYVSGYNFKDVLCLKTAQKAWVEGPPLGSIAGIGVNALSLEGSLYALGGNTAYLEKFDCSSGINIWQRVASAQQKHEYSGAAVLNGYIYVCGTTQNNPSTFCEQYDPSSDTWTTITPMNEARYSFSMVALNGYLYVIGGADADNERYSPTSNTWSSFSRVPSQKWLQAAATDGKAIYVVGGQNDDADWIKDVYAYQPELDTWQMKTPYEIEIREASAVFVKTLS